MSWTSGPAKCSNWARLCCLFVALFSVMIKPLPFANSSNAVNHRAHRVPTVAGSSLQLNIPAVEYSHVVFVSHIVSKRKTNCSSESSSPMSHSVTARFLECESNLIKHKF